MSAVKWRLTDDSSISSINLQHGVGWNKRSFIRNRKRHNNLPMDGEDRFIKRNDWFKRSRWDGINNFYDVKTSTLSNRWIWWKAPFMGYSRTSGQNEILVTQQSNISNNFSLRFGVIVHFSLGPQNLCMEPLHWFVDPQDWQLTECNPIINHPKHKLFDIRRQRGQCESEINKQVYSNS